MIDDAAETEEEAALRLARRRRSRQRAAIATAIALASLSAYLYVRYGVTKQGLGGPCKFAMHCKPEAPQCLRLSIEEEGACSRPCDLGSDCAPGIRCRKVGLGETDERGVPLEGGYCIPQTLLDARKKATDAGTVDAGHLDSWLPVPEVDGQLEGDLTLESGGATKTYTIKGTLLREELGTKRILVDAATLRTFSVDDAKHVFSVVALGGSPGDVRVDKTSRTDRVADRSCEIWELVEPRVTREACIVHGGALLEPGSRVAAPWARELAVRDALVLRLVERDARGHETTRLRVQRFDAHPVAAADFAIPHAYRNLAGN